MSDRHPPVSFPRVPSAPASASRRRFVQGAVVAAGALVGGPAWAAADPRLLRVGFQKGGGLLGLLKAQGRLEQVFGAQGWQVTWHEFAAGPQLLEALNAGSVDVGYTGAPPPIFAQAAGKDLVYIGAEPTADHVEAIIVKAGSPVTGVTGLRGKRVAVQRGSSANFLLMAGLEKAGVPFDAIEPVYLPPADARAAFESDRVDAWTIWDPYLSAVQASVPVRVLGDYTGLLHPNSFYEATRAFATRSPRQLGTLLDELARAGAWANANPAAMAQQLAPALGLPLAVAETWQRRTHYGVVPVDAAVVGTQQKVADAFLQQHLIPKRIEVASAVWRWPRD